MLEYPWIAVYTKANQERIAINNIIRQSYEVYCPMICKTRRHARKVDTVQKPLFPGYIFVNLNGEDRQWRPLLSTRGVQSVVRFGERLAHIPEKFVADLRQHEDLGLLNEMAKPTFSPGDNVEILDGPFKDVIAKVVSVSERDRIWLLLEMMGQKVRISHSISNVMRA